MSDNMPLVWPLKKGVEAMINKQIDKGAKDSEGTDDPRFQVSGNPDNAPEREPTVTKISSVEFYVDVKASVDRILEKRAMCGKAHGEKRKMKIPPQFLSNLKKK